MTFLFPNSQEALDNTYIHLSPQRFMEPGVGVDIRFYNGHARSVAVKTVLPKNVVFSLVLTLIFIWRVFGVKCS